jgi:hypothetical protein
MLYIKRSRLKSLLGWWVDGWVDGWEAGKAGLRIAYSNKKRTQTYLVIKCFQYIQHPKTGRLVVSDSILCQSRTFEYQTIQKPDKWVRFLNGRYPRPFYKEKSHKNILFMTKRSMLAKIS